MSDTKNIVKKLINKIVDSIMEDDVPVVDNGLNEDVKKEENNKIELEEIPTKEKEEVKPSSFFKKGLKDKETEDEVEEEPKSLKELLQTTPVKSVSQENNVSLETFPVFDNKDSQGFEKAESYYNDENATEELTQEQKDAELFYNSMKIRNEKIVGFEDTFYDVIELIEDNVTLSRERKLQKLNKIKKDFFLVNDDSNREIYNFYVSISHELYMLKNNLGEYNDKIANNKDLQVPELLEYRIADLFNNDELYVYLLDEDKQSYNELVDLVNPLLHKIQTHNILSSIPEKQLQYENYFKDLVFNANNCCQILEAKEILEQSLQDIETKSGMFKSTEILSL